MFGLASFEREKKPAWSELHGDRTMATRTSTLPPGIPPRGLNLEQASEYWGCCPSTFKKLMKLGVVRPIDMVGMSRNIFDRVALDAAMSARAVAS